MANFNDAFYITMGHEGGWSNDKNDAGGETYRGIARNYHPSWVGWLIVDDTKPNISDDTLEVVVKDFYKEHFWDVNKLDDFEAQDVANEMFDTGVNMGVLRAAKFLQECLNYLNRNSALYDDLVLDGKIGPASLSALSIIDPYDDTGILLVMLNVCQGRYYMKYMKKSSTQEKYARGWFSRVQITKE